MFKKVFKWSLIVLCPLIILGVIYASLGREKTLNLSIGSMDLSAIADGVYSGTYDCYRWTNKVEVSVKGHKIVGIRSLRAQTGRENVISELTRKVLSRQKLDVDAVTGATADSKAFLKAVENAFVEAKAGE